jgi:MOSC domain-containing protein YiiM
MEARSLLSAVEGKGLSGDAAFGTTRRQVLVIDSETLAAFDLAPGAVRENITIEGIQLHGIRRGARLHIADAVLVISGDCTPCDYIDSLRPGLRQAMAGRRGVLAQVERGGTLAVGSPVRLEIPEAASAPQEAHAR